MNQKFVSASVVASVVLSMFAAVVPAQGQILSDWSTPVNLTALNSSALDA